KAAKTDFLIFQLLAISSCLYFARKCMVSSTEIPKAILNTKIVEGFMGTPTKPITPAVIISGSKFGIKEITIILKLRNIHAINKAIKKMAKDSERIRLLTK